MNKFVSVIKSIRLGQVLTAFLAGVLLFVSTACAGNAQAKAPQGEMRGAGSNPVGQNQPYEGGMNNFSDTAPGQAAKGTAAKTKALVDRAERDINTKGANSVDKYVDNFRSGAPLGERVEKLTDSVKGAVKNTLEDAKELGDRASNASENTLKGAKNAAGNIKDNTEYAAKDASRSAKSVAKDAAQATEDAVKSTNRRIQHAD